MRCLTARNLAPAFWPSDYSRSYLDVAADAHAGSLSSRGRWLKWAALPPGRHWWKIGCYLHGRLPKQEAASRNLHSWLFVRRVRRGGDAYGGRSSVRAPGSPSCLWFAVTFLAKFFCPLVFKASHSALLAQKES